MNIFHELRCPFNDSRNGCRRFALTQQEIVDRRQSEMAQTLQAWAKEFSPEYVLSFMCEEFGLEVEGVRNSNDVMEF